MVEFLNDLEINITCKAIRKYLFKEYSILDHVDMTHWLACRSLLMNKNNQRYHDQHGSKAELSLFITKK